MHPALLPFGGTGPIATCAEAQTVNKMTVGTMSTGLRMLPCHMALAFAVGIGSKAQLVAQWQTDLQI